MNWALELLLMDLLLLHSCSSWEIEQFEVGDSQCNEVSIDFFTGTTDGCAVLNSPPNMYNLRVQEDNTLGTFQFYPSFEACSNDDIPAEIQFGSNDCLELTTLVAAFKVT